MQMMHIDMKHLIFFTKISSDSTFYEGTLSFFFPLSYLEIKSDFAFFQIKFKCYVFYVSYMRMPSKLKGTEYAAGMIFAELFHLCFL